MEIKKFNRKYLSNKNVVYVPIISSIDRDNDLYQLDADGNVARFVTFFADNSSFDHLTIFLPINNDGHMSILNKFVDRVGKDKVDLKFVEWFGKHAGEQRQNPHIVQKMYEEVVDALSINDTLIVESQKLADKMLKQDFTYGNIIYWCPVHKIDDKRTRDFLEGYDFLNNLLFDACDCTIVCSPTQKSQVESISGESHVLYYPKMIDLDIGLFAGEEWDINEQINVEKVTKNILYENAYYLPYRLTDMGYKIDKVVDMINHDKRGDIDVYFTDPNNSHQFDADIYHFNDNVRLHKISSSRAMHLGMLRTNVTVPYFEDLDFINHATLWEMLNSRSLCRIVITEEQWKLNPYNLKSNPRVFYLNKCNTITKE